MTRELDTQTIKEASVYVDRRESALNEAGDILFPIAEGAITPQHIRAEVGELLIRHHLGREGPKEITVFKSLGLGIEDVAAAHAACKRARELGLGMNYELGGVAQSVLQLASPISWK
jgi:ornithine cyclodeaminase